MGSRRALHARGQGCTREAEGHRGDSLLTRARVLIVDDESDFRATVAEYLNADGFEVVEAEDGVEALEQAKRTTPDRKSTRLNSSHVEISYAVFCLKKK